MQGVLAIALAAQVITVLEPEYRLLLRPEIQQRVGLTPKQTKLVMDAMKNAETAYSKMPLSERMALSDNIAQAKVALVMPAMHRLALTKNQKSQLISISVESYGPFLLRMQGMENHLRISQTQKVNINRDFAAVLEEYEMKFMVLARKSKIKFSASSPIPLTPPFQLIKTQRDKALWGVLLKHLTGPQVMKIIVLMKSDPWSALKN